MTHPNPFQTARPHSTNVREGEGSQQIKQITDLIGSLLTPSEGGGKIAGHEFVGGPGFLEVLEAPAGVLKRLGGAISKRVSDFSPEDLSRGLQKIEDQPSLQSVDDLPEEFQTLAREETSRMRSMLDEIGQEASMLDEAGQEVAQSTGRASSTGRSGSVTRSPSQEITQGSENLRQMLLRRRLVTQTEEPFEIAAQVEGPFKGSNPFVVGGPTDVTTMGELRAMKRLLGDIPQN